MNPPARILHVDLDAFFVSVERLHDPSLQEIELLIVGGDPEGRGVVTSASYAARAFGVRSAMSSALARRLCPEATFIRSSSHLYGAASRQVMEILRRMAPLVQPMGVDEAYLDLTGAERALGPLEEVAERIRSAVKAEAGLVCSVGGGSSKLVAKMATTEAKPDGVHIVAPGGEAAFLAPLPIEAMHGVGEATGERLRRIGVRTIGALRTVPRSVLDGAVGERLGESLRERAIGLDRSPVRPPGLPKSIGKETTFGEDIRDPARLREQLARLAAEAVSRLRRKELAARTVTVKLRTADWQTRTRAATLPAPCRDERQITRVGIDLLEALRGGGRTPVRLVGISLSGLANQFQADLFGSQDAEAIDSAVDAIRRRFGSGAVGWGTAARPVPPEKGG